MSSKRKLIMPTPEEDVAINRGIAADPDTYEMGSEEFKQLKKRVGRPRLDTPKVAVTIRYDKAVIDAFKAGGPGWQTRMNEALKKAVARKHA
ncbi:BrnA antitoxin family protein [Castellaniella hirudinis]|uniref:BrnA antitoxin family protein n=1 Tax=Castellaniella hirudinis TaxID=1144617 RepID=UPI0039C28E06